MELLKAKDHIETDIDVDFVRGSFNDEFSIRLSQFTTRIQRNLSIINAMHHYKLSKNVKYGVGNVFKINQKSVIDSLGFDVFSLDVPFKYDIYFSTGIFFGIRIFKKNRLENYGEFEFLIKDYLKSIVRSIIGSMDEIANGTIPLLQNKVLLENEFTNHIAYKLDFDFCAGPEKIKYRQSGDIQLNFNNDYLEQIDFSTLKSIENSKYKLISKNLFLQHMKGLQLRGLIAEKIDISYSDEHPIIEITVVLNITCSAKNINQKLRLNKKNFSLLQDRLSKEDYKINKDTVLSIKLI